MFGIFWTSSWTSKWTLFGVLFWDPIWGPSVQLLLWYGARTRSYLIPSSRKTLQRASPGISPILGVSLSDPFWSHGGFGVPHQGSICGIPVWVRFSPQTWTPNWGPPLGLIVPLCAHIYIHHSRHQNTIPLKGILYPARVCFIPLRDRVV